MHPYQYLVTAAIVLSAASGMARDGLTWTPLSTTRDELPPANGSNQQTTCVTADVDGDGATDFFITDRSTTPSVLLYRRVADGWEIYVVDNTALPIEAGGDAADIDGDGDLDLALGQDSSGGTVWWWENPFPLLSTNTPWTRRIIKSGGGSMQHDQRFGDLDGDGRLEFATWVNNANRVEVYEIPSDPTTSPWTLSDSLTLSGEGMDVADVDRDGVLDLIAGGHWIRHVGGGSYTANPIDASYGSSRVIAGQFIPGGRPEVLLNSGDTTGPLVFYVWDGFAWSNRTLLASVDHGHTLEAGDIDGDGYLDLFAAEMGNPGAGAACKAWIGWGDGTGGFTFELISTGIANHMSRLADADGDGDLDIVMKPYNFGAPRVDVFLNNGTGNVRMFNDTDEGRACYRIETRSATYLFDKAGGGLVSLLDRDGTDWIQWNPAAGSAGAYRGIPNLAELHPGLDGGVTTTMDPLATPLLRATLETSRNGWEARWEFFADHAVMTLHTMPAATPYWILYEGTPGGAIDPADRLYLSNGRDYASDLDHPWGAGKLVPDNFEDIANTSGAAPGTEWAYITASETNRALFLALTDDTVEDDYWQLDDNMTVLGFGRSDASQPLITAASNRLVVGFAEAGHPEMIQQALHQAWDAKAPFSSGTAPFTGLPFNEVLIDTNHMGHRVVADIDGDGANDILSVNFIDGAHAVVWYAYPDWTRHVIVEMNTYGDYTQYRSDDLAAADIDGDGDLDAIGRVGPADDGNGLVVWWENPRPGGAATNRPWTRHDIGNTDYVKDLAVEDFDLDGRPDVAARETEETHVFRQASSSMWVRVLQRAHPSHEGMASGDLDADGDPDLVLNGFWLRNPHPADLTNAWTDHSIDATWYTQSGGWQANNSNVEVGDLNDDGRLDVILSQSELPGYPLSWYEAVDPVNGPWTEHVIEPVFDYCQTIQAGDINRDGKLDLLAAEFPRYDAPYPVRIYYNEGGGQSWIIQELSDLGIYHGVLGDVGSDRDLDVVGVRSYDESPILIWENQLANLVYPLTDWQYIQVDDSRAKWGDWDTPTWSKYFGLAMADATGDGFQDIVSGRYFYRNPGGAMTAAWTHVDLGLNCDAGLFSDVDGDGWADVIAPAGDKVYWLEATASDGSTWSNTVIDAAFPKPDHGNPQGYRSAQILEGGRPEILLNGDSLYLYTVPETSPETGGWSRVAIVAESNGEGIGIGDIDGDGDLDVAVAHNGPSLPEGSVKWARNPGNATGLWTTHAVGGIANGYADRVAIAELNGDGRPDIVVTEEGQSLAPEWSTYWFEAPADPAQSNWVRHTLVTQHTSNAMDVEDMDNDGDIDIIVGEHRGTEKLSVWENDGAGNFTEQVVDTGKESHLGARAADLDDDGDFDLVSICWDDYQDLHVWRNDNGGVGAIIASNRAPVVHAGPDRFVLLPQVTVDLDGSITDDGKPADGIISSRWEVVSGPPGVVVDNPSAPRTFATFPGTGTWELELIGWDSLLAATSRVTVRVGEAGSDLLLDWRFREGQGTAAGDESLYLNHGTLNGAGWHSGRFDTALSLDGFNQYASRASAALNGPFPGKDAAATDFSVCAWIKLDTLGQRNPVCGKQGNEQRGFMFMIESSDSLALEVFRATGSPGTRVASSATLSAGVWTHVAATYTFVADGTSLVRLYINGIEDGGTDFAEGPVTVNTTSLDVGRYYWSSSHHPHFDGLIDEVQVFSRALTPGEIQTVMGGDVDRDGLPDGWEFEMLGTTAYNGSVDLDGDHMGNFDEYLSDTHPTNGQDVLRARLNLVSNHIEVIFDASTARVYSLRSADTRIPLQWQEVPGATGHWGLGIEDRIMDPREHAPGRLYQLRAILP